MEDQLEVKETVNYFQNQCQADTRQFRYLKLANDMKVMLVEDINSKNSACCLSVNIGSLEDPEGSNGLAHLLEHMLFAGTKKFSDENYFGQFVTTNGGNRNAQTGEDLTMYFFDVSHSHFQQALEIFCEFFHSPLFNEQENDKNCLIVNSAIERERLMVDTEFKKNLSSEEKRIYQFIKSVVANQGSKLNRFGTGNAESLQIDDIKEKLKDFFTKYYSSNLMAVTLVGNHSLDELQNMAIKYFGGIKNKDVKIPVYDKPSFNQFINNGNLGNLFKIVSEKQIQKLILTWPNLEPFQKNWRTKPSYFITNVLGHEGPNSLLSELVRYGLATKLMANESTRLRNQFGQIDVTITLTQLGFENYGKVLQLVFKFLEIIKQEDTSKYFYFYDELKIMGETIYHQLSIGSPIQTAQSKSQQLLQMNYLEHATWLNCKDHVYMQFDPELIDKILEQMTPENAFYILIDKNTHEKLADLQIEKYYKTKYRVETGIKIEPYQEQVKMGYCPKNPFYFNKTPQTKLFFGQQQKHPQKIITNDGHTLWFKQDDKFKQPLIWSRVYIKTNDCDYQRNPDARAFLQLWIKMYEEYQREIQYCAQLCGREFNLSPEKDGFCILFFGFNESFEEFQVYVFKSLQNFNVDKQTFEGIRQKWLGLLNNALKSEPYYRSTEIASSLIKKGEGSIEELQQSVSNIDFDKFVEMKKQWLKNISFEWLIQGHITKEEAIQLVNTSCSQLKDFKILQQDQLQQFSEPLILKPKCVLNFESQNTDQNENSSFLALFQCCQDSDYEKLANLLMIQQLHKEKILTQLRTKEQLCYLVACNVLSYRNMSHFIIRLQSANKNADFLENRVNAYLEDNCNWTPTENELKSAQNALCNQFKINDQKINNEAQRNWSQIVTGLLKFDMNQEKSDAIKKTTINSIQQTLKSITNCEFGRMNIRIFSQKEFATDRTEIINKNIDYYQGLGCTITS